MPLHISSILGAWHRRAGTLFGDARFSLLTSVRIFSVLLLYACLFVAGIQF